MTIRRNLLLFAAVCGLAACTDPPPPGADLVVVDCKCRDSCAGDAIPVRGEVCTESGDPDNLAAAKEFICKRKETVGIGDVCKIENCVPQGIDPILDGCPEDNGDYNAGDFAQATASAIDPSVVHVGGDDIIDFSISPETFIVTTTQSGSTLFFGSFVGTLATTGFESDGIFTNSDHTLSEGRISGGPFAVALEPDGTFVIPPGSGNFIVTGKIDGDRLSLTITTLNLQGVYDEALGIFELAGTVQAVGADISLTVDLVFAFVNRPPRANAGPDQTVECDDGQHTVHLSGAGSTDLEGAADITRYSWFVDAGPELATGPEVDLSIALGAHEVTLAVADRAGSFGTDIAIVDVQDTLAPTVTCPEKLRVEADPTTCIGALPDVTQQSVITDACSPDALTVVQDPPDGTPLSVGQHVIEIEATDPQGLTSVACPTLVTVSLPINRSPDVVRYLDAQLGDDFLRVHGRISPCEPLDPSLTDFEVTLSNAQGDIYRTVLPVGAIEKKGKYRWIYRDRTASIRHDGIRDLRITYVPSRDRYQIRLHTYGDLSLATEARMTLELRFGGSFFATTNDWASDGLGWRVKDF